jgi:hypothetical protein
MNKIISLLTLCFLFGVNCTSEENKVTSCDKDLISESDNFHELILSLPDYIVSGLTKNPDSNGALGRNLDGYFHVRFQMDIGFLSSYTSYFKSDDALQKFILATEYSFDRQKPEGDFELVIPSNLEYLGPPSQVDLVSGTSFFISAMGSSLVLLKQSPWFTNRPNDALKQRLNALTSKFQLALNYLKTQKEVLKNYDIAAPNRLFFDALAFYSLGSYLNDSEGKAIGLEFIELALTKQDSAGFYIEGDGFDSSYNGVSLRLGLVLLGILPSQDEVYGRLKKSLSCSVQWQASRVLETGEISLAGNTRVYPGGEDFLGSAKEIAWVESLLAFYFTYSFSADKSYEKLSKKIELFYN